MNTQKLASPFSSATVVMSDDFVDTFPHPRGLLAYLCRLCFQLDVHIVSLERPVTVKGSWKSIIKIDGFLKTLISSLNGATVEGAVGEDYFNAVFANFEYESSYESLVTRHTSQPVHDSNDISELKTDDFLEVIKTDEDNFDTHVLDKWYFNSNPRGKTTDKRQSLSSSGKTPPEPFVIVEADNTVKERKASLVEIEQVLSQVYKKETIEKYQQKSYCNDRQSQETVVLDEIDSVKEITNYDINSIKRAFEHKPCKDQSDTEKDINMSQKNNSLNSFKCAKGVTLENEFERPEALPCDFKEETLNDVSLETSEDNSRSPVPRRITRQTNSEKKKIAESMNRTSYALKEHMVFGRGRKKRKNNRTNTEEVPQMTNREISKDNTKVKQPSWKSPRLNSKTAAEDSSHHSSIKTTNSMSKQMQKITEQSENNLVKTKINSKVNLKRCKYIEKKNKETRNLHRRDTVNTQYKCDKCSYLTTKQLQLFEHKRRVHLVKKFRCDECQKEFGFRKDLRRHMKCHRKADNCCDQCGKMYKDVRKLSEHKKIHVDGYVKPEFPCKFCSKKFSTKYVLAYHVKYDHLGMKRSYMCPTCGKSFSQKYSYMQHANVHLGIKPFSCDICGKKFSYEKSMKEHKFTHNEEKVYSCTFCNKSFRQSSGLSIHLKVHKTTKDYVCSMCGKGFTQKQALVRHERIHGGDKPYECGVCKRTFADSSVLRRHMILIHKRDPKLWRQDTLFHVPRRSDFFISVLNEDSLHSDDSEDEIFEDEISEKAFSKKLEQQQQSLSWQQENKQQNQFKQSQPLPQHVDKIIPTHLDDVMLKNVKSSLTVLREPIATVVESFADVSCADVKPYFGYVLEKGIATNSVITSVAATTNHLIDTGLFSSTALHNHSTLPVNRPITLPAHCVRSVMTYPNHTPITVHPSQTQSTETSNLSPFVPVTYNQRPVNYDRSNIQHVPYSTMMAQPYSHTILVHPDNFGTIAYHEPGINANFSHENQQHINPSVTLSSSPDSNMMDISKAVASVSSEHIYNQVLSIGHHHPH